MNGFGKCLLWGLALGALTAWLGWLGIKDWSGEDYSATRLVYFGLPMIYVLFATRSLVVGVAAQVVVCVALVCSIGAIRRMVVRPGPVAIGSGGGDAPPGDASDSA